MKIFLQILFNNSSLELNSQTYSAAFDSSLILVAVVVWFWNLFKYLFQKCSIFQKWFRYAPTIEITTAIEDILNIEWVCLIQIKMYQIFFFSQSAIHENNVFITKILIVIRTAYIWITIFSWFSYQGKKS